MFDLKTESGATMQGILQKINSGSARDRLATLNKIILAEKEPPVALPQYANNHIHTNYSFSPYSPTAAVYFAREAGLQTAGIMDHDSIGGAQEFIAAGKIAGLATTIGLECRVSLEGTLLEGRTVNNPDQKSNAYMALHGVPHTQINYLQDFFSPLREKRNIRNKKMVEKINALVSSYGVVLDFEKDILPTSQFAGGGCVTERHLLYVLGEKLSERVGRHKLISVLENDFRISLSENQKTQLNDPQNPYFLYDLLGVLKSSLVERIYIPASDECMSISQLSCLAAHTGALLCYSYLGDVGESVTGDKKAQKFEDDYLDLLFDVIQEHHINAVTYMPSRNTPEQLRRIQKICRERGIIEISGEDINSPRQRFICKQLAQPQFTHLIDATWNLIAREKAETQRQLNKIN
ncbi:MAG TPA: PHP domain-containing protein [Clostridia bacterium]|nr:PHP domain-containing protein [Clostridia bacterium]